MVYNIPAISSMLKKCSEQIEELQTECVELGEKIKASRTQLRLANRTMHYENHRLKAKCKLSNIKIDKLKTKNEQLETECARLKIKNFELQSEDESCNSDTSFQADDIKSTFQDIIGHRKYSREIRKLYHTLLADQVPISKFRCESPG